MPARADLLEHIAQLVGDDVLRITERGSGWPGHGRMRIGETWISVSLYVAPVGLSHRGRDDVERRFQNPGGGRPITKEPRRYPLLVGLWEEDSLMSVGRPILVSADPMHRVGRTTRFSVFVSVNTLNVALRTGWAEDPNAIGERIRCFAPPLLAVSCGADRAGVAPATDAVRAVVDGSGLLTAPEPELQAAAERARRAASTLVRDARFRRRVAEAYGGLCAMCGLDSDLVEGAHIYPVAAPGSTDEPSNGLALCPNHHAAFDRHVLAVRPGTSEIVFHESLRLRAATNSALRLMVENTFQRLSSPRRASARPQEAIFAKRYAFFDPKYAWMEDQ